MVGHPKHVKKALDAGVDLICAQAGEGGGHTGDIPASILIPACVDAVKGHKSPLTGKPVYVVGAGAVYDGRGLAANLSWGAEAVWVGTRFVASVEAGAPKAHKEALLSAGYEDAVTTLIYTGRPLRVRRTPYVDDWYVHLSWMAWIWWLMGGQEQQPPGRDQGAHLEGHHPSRARVGKAPREVAGWPFVPHRPCIGPYQ